LTVFVTVIETEDVVIEPPTLDVQPLVFPPPFRFHDATLDPVPPDLPKTQTDVTVVESPYLYHPSDVSEEVEYVIPLPPLTTSWS
jgi:hypothetical protein